MPTLCVAKLKFSQFLVIELIEHHTMGPVGGSADRGTDTPAAFCAISDHTVAASALHSLASSPASVASEHLCSSPNMTAGAAAIDCPCPQAPNPKRMKSLYHQSEQDHSGDASFCPPKAWADSRGALTHAILEIVTA